MMGDRRLWTSGAICASVGLSAIGWLAYRHRKDLLLRVDQEEKKRMEAERYREQERAGRIAAERALRHQHQPQEWKNLKGEHEGQQHEEGIEPFEMQPIGILKSPFKERYGTPRQGCLVPHSRAMLRLDFTTNPSASMCNLQEFSHVWLVFIFHQNTNAARKVKMDALTTQPNNKNLSVVKSKVKPPRLAGKKVGLFSTRTPHRPNPIGLSIAKIEKIDADGTLHLSGVDLLDGTPILDIKPYVKEYDSLTDAVTAGWLDVTEQSPFSEVLWTPTSEQALMEAMSSIERYDSVEDVKSTIEEILRLDIRTLHQKNSEGAIYNFKFDSLAVFFSAHLKSVTVTDIQVCNPIL